MTDRFVDTSGWAGWASARDQYHDSAVAVIEATWQAGGRLVTTNWVLCELTALLTSPLHLPKPTQVRILDGIRSDPAVDVVPIDPPLEAAAWALWRGRLDKDWSLVDCASFAVMTARGLADAVSADHHFDQAGFARLLR